MAEVGWRGQQPKQWKMDGPKDGKLKIITIIIITKLIKAGGEKRIGLMDREDTSHHCQHGAFFVLAKYRKRPQQQNEITKYIAQHGKSFSESIFIKERLISVTEIMSLGKV